MQENSFPKRVYTLLITGFLPFFLCAQFAPQTEYTHAPNTPEWATLMYNHPEEVDAIRSGFEEWRKENPGVKNNHSQYYKRWVRQAQWPKPVADAEYAAKHKEAKAMRSGEWSEMGPWHYDPEVAMYFEVQSPGACHVYTVEQSKSNPNVVYCGTATAGMYKSTNKGLNWELITRDLPVTQVYSIAIDADDEDLIWLGEENCLSASVGEAPCARS